MKEFRFFSTVDRGATRGKRCGEDPADGGGDPGERQGSAAGPRPQSGAEAHGNAGLRGRRRSPALRWGGRHQKSAVFRQSSSTLLFFTVACRWCCSGAAEGREGVCRGTSKSENNRSSRQARFGVASSHPCPARLHQINFLNSVIVDLQRKNEELKIKLKKLALAEFNGNDETDGWETTDPFLQKKLEQLQKEEILLLNLEKQSPYKTNVFFQSCWRLKAGEEGDAASVLWHLWLLWPPRHRRLPDSGPEPRLCPAHGVSRQPGRREALLWHLRGVRPRHRVLQRWSDFLEAQTPTFSLFHTQFVPRSLQICPYCIFIWYLCISVLTNSPWDIIQSVSPNMLLLCNIQESDRCTYRFTPFAFKFKWVFLGALFVA